MANNNVLCLSWTRDQRQKMLGQYLIPSKFDHLVNELSTVFRAYLPELATWRPGIARWRMKFHDGFENILISLQQSLSDAHADFYPNIRCLFMLLLTLPVTGVWCERSFSSLCRLKTWERATMGEERLCDELTKRDTGKLEHCSLNNNSYLQIIPTLATTCIAHYFCLLFYIEHITTTWFPSF
jgi:hypothetical protein